MSGRTVLPVLALIVALVAPIAHGGVARTAETRYVSASAICRSRGSSPTPVVEVSITNRSGLELYVAHTAAFATDQAIGPNGLRGLPQDDPGEWWSLSVPNQETWTTEVTWSGSAPRQGQVAVALIVTSAGVFLPACVQNNSERFDYPNPLPVLAGDEPEESARIAALAIGQLESWRAYPALYALLHPDAREYASFETVACWYAAWYGPPVTSSTPSIFSTTVENVRSVIWTWPLNDLTYQAAEVTITQQVGSMVRTEPLESVVHLVRVGGVWRWFFGTDGDAVAELPAECGLPETT